MKEIKTMKKTFLYQQRILVVSFDLGDIIVCPKAIDFQKTFHYNKTKQSVFTHKKSYKGEETIQYKKKSNLHLYILLTIYKLLCFEICCIIWYPQQQKEETLFPPILQFRKWKILEVKLTVQCHTGSMAYRTEIGMHIY